MFFSFLCMANICTHEPYAYVCEYVYIYIAYMNCENKMQNIYVFQTAVRKTAT